MSDRKNHNSFLTQTDKQTFYIRESDGEFMAVEYDKEGKDTKTFPLNSINYPSKQDLTKSKQSEEACVGKEKERLNLEDHSPNQPTQQASQTKPKSARNLFVTGIGLGLLLALGINYLFSSIYSKESVVAASENEVIPQAKPKTVTVVEVTSSPIEETLEASGTVYAYELIPVMTPATGLQITSILTDEGNFVNQGQVLAKLNDNTLQAELVQAQATVRQVEARLAELKAGARAEEIARAREQVTIAKANLSQAESELDLVQKRVQRNRALKQEGAISLDRLDEILNQEKSSRANLQQGKARLEEAQQQLAQLQAGVRPEIITQAEAEVSQARGRVQYIQARIQDTIVTTPVSGIVARRNARLGEITSPSETLFSIIEDGKLELRLQVPETLIRAIQPEQKVRILNNNLQVPSIMGTVREVAPIIDGDSRQGTVKVDLPSQPGLKPGMFLRAKITTDKIQGKTLPTQALLPQADGTAIAFVVEENNRVQAKSVEIGSILPNNYVEVLSGLESGDRIVLKGAAYLKDGDLIKVSESVANSTS